MVLAHWICFKVKIYHSRFVYLLFILGIRDNDFYVRSCLSPNKSKGPKERTKWRKFITKDYDIFPSPINLISTNAMLPLGGLMIYSLYFYSFFILLSYLFTYFYSTSDKNGLITMVDTETLVPQRVIINDDNKQHMYGLCRTQGLLYIF